MASKFSRECAQARLFPKDDDSAQIPVQDFIVVCCQLRSVRGTTCRMSATSFQAIPCSCSWLPTSSNRTRLCLSAERAARCRRCLAHAGIQGRYGKSGILRGLLKPRVAWRSGRFVILSDSRSAKSGKHNYLPSANRPTQIRRQLLQLFQAYFRQRLGEGPQGV